MADEIKITGSGIAAGAGAVGKKPEKEQEEVKNGLKGNADAYKGRQYSEEEQKAGNNALINYFLGAQLINNKNVTADKSIKNFSDAEITAFINKYNTPEQISRIQGIAQKFGSDYAAAFNAVKAEFPGISEGAAAAAALKTVEVIE